MSWTPSPNCRDGGVWVCPSPLASWRVAAQELLLPVMTATIGAAAILRATVGAGPIYGQRGFDLESYLEFISFAALGGLLVGARAMWLPAVAGNGYEPLNAPRTASRHTLAGEDPRLASASALPGRRAWGGCAPSCGPKCSISTG